jgi:IS30 family transposase
VQRFTEAEKERIWDMHQAGVPVKRIARVMGRQNVSLRTLISGSGGIRPRAGVVNERCLSLAEREEISRGFAAGLSLRARYRALVADAAARKPARRPKAAKLARCRRLRAKVETKLAAKWSPEEISGWRARTYPNDPEMYVSHETIYQSIFVQGRGALRHELHVCLRSGRAMRRNKKRVKSGHGMGKIRDMVMITERPAEAENRAGVRF